MQRIPSSRLPVPTALALRRLAGILALALGLTLAAARAQATRPPTKFDRAPVLHLKETPGTKPGESTRIRIIQADFHYPLVRVTEKVMDNGKERRVDLLGMTVADHVLVGLKPGVDAAGLSRRLGYKLRRKLLGHDYYLFEVPATPAGVPQAIEKLRRDPAVLFAEPDPIVYADKVPNNSAYYPSQWALENTGQSGGTADADIDASSAWDFTTGSSSVLVAVLDTGIDYHHDDLTGNVHANLNEDPDNGIDDDGDGLQDNFYGFDFINVDGDPIDDEGHGTSVAGIIGAIGNNSLGTAGVCWNVRLMAVKVLDDENYGVGSSVVQGISYARIHGADIINLSLGFYLADVDAGSPWLQGYSGAVGEAKDEGILVVASAGNDGLNTDIHVHYPSGINHANVISVAATDHNDNLVDESDWWASNYGPSTVDLAAPGLYCYSTVTGGQNGIDYFHGTSCAAPYVAGVCALVKSHKPGWDYLKVKAAVLQSVDKKPQLDGKVATGGRLNAHKALQVADGDIPLAIKAYPDFYTVPFNMALHGKEVPDPDTATSVSLGPNLLANDVLPAGATPSVQNNGAPSQGGYFWPNYANPGDFIYKALDGFVGTETAPYLVHAGPLSAAGWVAVTTLAPTAEDDAYSSGDATVEVVAGPTVFDNDGFGQYNFEPVIVQQPAHGTLAPELDANNIWTGRFTYVRTQNLAINAEDAFTYKVTFPAYGNLETGLATVTLTTHRVDPIFIEWEEIEWPWEKLDWPVIFWADASAGEALEIILHSTGPGLGVSISAPPRNGRLRIEQNKIVYTPNRGFSGADTFIAAVRLDGKLQQLQFNIAVK